MPKPQDVSKNQPQEAFYMAAVELAFHDAEMNVGTSKVNVLVRSPAEDEGRITLKLLGRTQQQAQIQLAQKVKDPTIKVFDVIVLAISFLGIMTEEQFRAGTNEAGEPVDEQPTKRRH